MRPTRGGGWPREVRALPRVPAGGRRGPAPPRLQVPPSLMPDVQPDTLHISRSRSPEPPGGSAPPPPRRVGSSCPPPHPVSGGFLPLSCHPSRRGLPAQIPGLLPLWLQLRLLGPGGSSTSSGRQCQAPTPGQSEGFWKARPGTKGQGPFSDGQTDGDSSSGLTVP